MSKLKRIFTNSKVILLLIFLALGLAALHPNPWNAGLQIKAVAKNSSAQLAGFEPPKESLSPMSRERVIAVNNKQVNTVSDYYDFVSSLKPNQTVQVKTSKGSYRLVAQPRYNITVLNQTERVLVNKTSEVNETVNGTNHLINKTVEVNETRPKILREVIGVEPLGLTVDAAPTSNIRKGLDLQGGIRAVLKPEAGTTQEQIIDAMDILNQRLNVYGLSDILITEVSGGTENFILVEIAGASEEEVLSLVNGTGKFEAKIGNNTVFSGGQDITYVCRTAQCSGIDPNRGCGKSQDGYGCAFMFSITLSPESAQRQADLTKDMPIVGTSLSEQLVLLLDGQEVERLNIGADLRGRATTDVAISGGGKGTTQQSATNDALQNMKRLQTVLKTGSLPVKLELERVDSISPTLGAEFLSNSFFVGILSLLAVTVILVIAYHRLTIAIPIILTAVCEVFLTIAIAVLIGQNIDLAAVAGIVLAVGTGVSDQIIITSEAINEKGADISVSWKDRIKRAFFIITSSYMITMVAMVPLLFAGAGLLRGFAITTMLAVSVGILLTRPAYAAVVHELIEK